MERFHSFLESRRFWRHQKGSFLSMRFAKKPHFRPGYPPTKFGNRTSSFSICASLIGIFSRLFPEIFLFSSPNFEITSGRFGGRIPRKKHLLGHAWGRGRALAAALRTVSTKFKGFHLQGWPTRTCSLRCVRRWSCWRMGRWSAADRQCTPSPARSTLSTFHSTSSAVRSRYSQLLKVAHTHLNLDCELGLFRREDSFACTW